MKSTALPSGAKWNLIVTLGVTCLGLFLVMASVTALNVAASDISVDSGASQKELTWIVDGYTLALAGLLLPAGALGDRYGRRLLLQIGLGVFTLASLLPLAVSSPGALIASRVVVGVGAACIMPATLSLISCNLPARQRSLGVSVWAATISLGGVMGLVLAGGLLEVAGWVSIFVVLATMSGMVLLFTPLVAPSRETDQPPLDLPGSVFSVVCIVAGVLAVIEGPIEGWSDPRVVACLLLSAVAATLFVVIELTVPHPLLDVRLLRVPAFAASSLCLLVFMLMAFGSLYIDVQFLQFVHGYSGLGAGAVMSIVGLSVAGATLVASRAGRLFGLRLVFLISIAMLLGAALTMSTIDVDDGLIPMLVSVLLLGAGLGLGMPPATSAILDSVPADRQGVASAVNDLARELGAALGIALVGSLLAAGYSASLSSSMGSLPESQRVLAEESIVGAQSVARTQGDDGQPLLAAADEAFAEGLQEAGAGLAVAIVVSGGALLLLAPGRDGAIFAAIWGAAVRRRRVLAASGSPAD